jgi:hypothetical protein
MRPPRVKYDPDNETQGHVARFCEAVRRGATYQLAAKYAGISDECYRQWRLKYPAFDERVRAAEGKAGMEWLLVIDREALAGNWQAAAWKLERRYPQEYGRRVQEIQGKDGGDLFHSPDWLKVQALIVGVTTEYPEMRESLGAALLALEGPGSVRD